MYVVTVGDVTTTFFNDCSKAIAFADAKFKAVRYYDDGTVSYCITQRVVIHEIDPELEYSNDYLMTETNALRIYDTAN